MCPYVLCVCRHVHVPCTYMCHSMRCTVVLGMLILAIDAQLFLHNTQSRTASSVLVLAPAAREPRPAPARRAAAATSRFKDSGLSRIIFSRVVHDVCTQLCASHMGVLLYVSHTCAHTALGFPPRTSVPSLVSGVPSGCCPLLEADACRQRPGALYHEREALSCSPCYDDVHLTLDPRTHCLPLLIYGPVHA